MCSRWHQASSPHTIFKSRVGHDCVREEHHVHKVASGQQHTHHVPVSRVGRPVTVGEGGASRAGDMRPTATVADGLYEPHTFSLSGAKQSSRLHLMLSMASMPVAACVNPHFPGSLGPSCFCVASRPTTRRTPTCACYQYPLLHFEAHTSTAVVPSTPHFQAVGGSAFLPWTQGLLHAEPRPGNGPTEG